jgi:hypothetical protein
MRLAAVAPQLQWAAAALTDTCDALVGGAYPLPAHYERPLRACWPVRWQAHQPLRCLSESVAGIPHKRSPPAFSSSNLTSTFNLIRSHSQPVPPHLHLHLNWQSTCRHTWSPNCEPDDAVAANCWFARISRFSLIKGPLDAFDTSSTACSSPTVVSHTGFKSGQGAVSKQSKAKHARRRRNKTHSIASPASQHHIPTAPPATAAARGRRDGDCRPADAAPY